MSIKTNKSYSKRLKVTKTGKILARKGGKNHFNAKESRSTQMKGKKLATFRLKNKPASHLMAGSK
jgi:ribosomal protein L35